MTCGCLLFVTAGSLHGAPDLAWRESDGFRSAPLAVASTGFSGFTRIEPSITGVTFTNHLSAMAVARNRLLANGSGVALGDVDGDGLVDVYFCRLEGDNVLYRNLGDWRFEDITTTAGVACPSLNATGCALADLEGDGDLDLLVNSLGGGTRAFMNDGRARFAELQGTRLAREFGATSMALGDVDGDGDLDLYVTNYRTDTFHDPPRGGRFQTRMMPDGSTVVEPRERFLGLPTLTGALEVLERGEPDFFYLNRGGTNFVPAPWNVGVFLDEDGNAYQTVPTDWGLAVMFRDFNGDHLPDLYVCNDFIYWPDRLWLNQGGRRFQAAPRTALRCTSLASMSVDVADLNRDGFDDFFVADMPSPRRELRARQRPDTLAGVVRWPLADPAFRPEVPRNTLQLARGDGTFAEIALFAGVAATDWTWTVAFLDVDLDGWEDLLVTAGNVHDIQDVDTLARLTREGGWKSPEARLQSYAQLPRRNAPLMAFRNRRDLTFEDSSAAWHFDTLGIAHGMALGDLDNDGDLDAVINCLNEPARLFRNESPAPRLAIRLKGANGNTRGIGAKIRVTGGPVVQSQEMIAGGRYCSSDDPMRVFAAGTVGKLEVEVTWRSGRRSVLREVTPNQMLEISEARIVEPAPSRSAPEPLFEDAGARLQHTHVDIPFDDFGRQPLLPRQLSSGGPGLAWCDLDDDGDDDLLVGGGRDGRLVVFRNEGKAGFVEQTEPRIPKTTVRDQTSILPWHGSNGVRHVLVGSSNWEDAQPQTPRFDIFALGESPAYTNAQPQSGISATGPMAMADVDGDGDLDLFVGSRVVAGRYPEKGESLLLENEADVFRVRQSFPALGLVNGAVFTDFDADGDPDLVLACEWDSLRLFRNDVGKLVEATAETGLAGFRGFWNGVTTGDFDGDGRMDLVASNWGRNWRNDQPPTAQLPVELFYGEFAGNGIVQPLLASLDLDLQKVTPWREWLAIKGAVPSVAERFPSHHAYSRTSVTDLLGDQADRARKLTAETFDSMVFLNRDGRFEAHPLPLEAQLAPAFGVSVADFDGDGNEDVFLAQNFFGVDAETSRHDAGTGLVLLGGGRGGFRALRPQEAGFSLYGEQRASAVADFDRDGRVDLAITQHGGPTRLLRNVRGKAGVRVTVQGSPQNPGAVGAVVRLLFGDRAGPVREIHGGAGYLAYDSTSPVLAAPTPPTAVEVHRPDGSRQRLNWPVGARAVVVRPDGSFAR